jgi:hypothetical protein
VQEGNKGFFIHRLRDFVNIMKDYTFLNMNSILRDFNEPIQAGLNHIMEDFEVMYITQPDSNRLNETRVAIDFGLIPVQIDSNFCYSPIIYENYLAF